MTTQQPDALAADHSEQNLEMVARWYMVNKDGMATLCTDRADAEKEAEDAQSVWPHMGPHRAVQLVEVASVAASAGSEPVAWPKDATEVREFVGGHFRSLFYANPTSMDPHENDVYELTAHDLLSAFRWWEDLQPSPPEGMVEGWIAIPGALPEPGTPVLLDIGKKYPIRAMWAAKHTVEAAYDDTDWGEYDEATDTYYCPEGWYEWNEQEDRHWLVDKTPVAWCELPPNGGASHGQAPAQAAPVCGSPADLPPLPDPDLRDVGTKPEDIKNFLRGYATEYAKAALASSAPADSVLEDAARESEYRRGYRHGYEQRDAEVRGALA